MDPKHSVIRGLQRNIQGHHIMENQIKKGLIFNFSTKTYVMGYGYSKEQSQ